MKINKKLSALLLAGYMSLTSLPAGADTVTPDDNTSKLNMRTEASIGSERITGIPNGENAMRIMSCDNNWDVVVYKNNIGYVCRDYLKLVSDSKNPYDVIPAGGEVIATDDVNMRLGPGKEYAKIGSIGKGGIATGIGFTNDGWILLKYNNKLGFVSSEYLSLVETAALNEEKEQEYISKIPYVYTITSVNLRKGPSVESERYKVLKSGVCLEVVGFTNGFYQVMYEGNMYYVSSKYVASDPNSKYRDDIIKVVYANTDSLNLREDSNTDSRILYTLDKYEVCEVLGEKDDFYLVRVNNMIGYVYQKYVTNLNNTFIVVDISEQKLTVYDGNDIYLETDVVTGKKGEHDTPTGMYKMGSKDTDTYLSSQKYGYNTHVDYWMPFNGGIGLHDAAWRNKFGGSIYENNGSHGCVNIPHNDAEDIYNHVKRGTKVLVHK